MLVTGRLLGQDVCRVLGLDPAKVGQLTIILDPGKPAQLLVLMYVTAEDSKSLVTLLADYELVEKEQTDDKCNQDPLCPRGPREQLSDLYAEMDPT